MSSRATREPSHESQVHLAVYERRADAVPRSCMPSRYTPTLFGVLHKPIAPLHVGTLIDVRGEVPVMPFAPSGSRQFGYDMLEVMGDKQCGRLGESWHARDRQQLGQGDSLHRHGGDISAALSHGAAARRATPDPGALPRHVWSADAVARRSA